MRTPTVAAQILAFGALAQVVSACMFATFGYDPCSGKVIGSIDDNGHYYGQILEQTPMEQISTPQGVLISLTPTLRDQGYGAYVHEVRSEDGNSGYLSHVTIHQGPEGTEVGGFELVKDKNGHYSNALYGCDELDDMSWFKSKPEYGGKGGWDRWGGQYPTFDINTAWLRCNPEPEQPVQFKIITADAPPQPSGDGETIAAEAKRGEQQKRVLSKEEIKAMQDRDFLRRKQADKTQSKRAVKADNVQGKNIIKRTKPTPERSAKIKHSDFAGLEHAMDALARGVDYEDIEPAMSKFEANTTPVAEPTAAVEAMQKMQGVQAWQWQKRGVAWNPDKLKQNKLTARAMVPDGPRETDVRRYQTTAW